MLAVKNIVLGLEELDSKVVLLLVGRCNKKMCQQEAVCSPSD